jgi:hypothetical protein
MKPLCLGLLLAALAVAPALAAAQESDVPAPKTPAVAKPANTQQPADPREAKPTPAARPVARRVATPPVPVSLSIKTYKGDVPTDPGMRPWQPPPRKQR